MKTYTIKEVSQMFHLPSSTLRYYEDMGILTNVERTKNHQRIYTEGHINRLKTICCFKETGMSIARLQQFFSYETNEEEHVHEIVTLLEEQKEQVQQQICQFHLAMQQIDRKLHYYRDIEQAVQNQTERPHWSDYRNKNF